MTAHNFDAVLAQKYFIICVPTAYGKLFPRLISCPDHKVTLGGEYRLNTNDFIWLEFWSKSYWRMCWTWRETLSYSTSYYSPSSSSSSSCSPTAEQAPSSSVRESWPSDNSHWNPSLSRVLQWVPHSHQEISPSTRAAASNRDIRRQRHNSHRLCMAKLIEKYNV